jgi:hypothetical protein
MLYTQIYIHYEVVLCDFCGWWMVTVVPEIVEANEESLGFLFTYL